MTLEFTYETSIIPANDRIKSIRGHYRVIARCGDVADFAIAPTEEEAKDKATNRLHYRLGGFQ